MKTDNKEISAIEVTSFKLNGYTMTDFIAINRPIDIWLKQQTGFRSRYIAQQKDGRIQDILFWDSVQHGSEAMHNLMDVFSDSPIHSMIDQGTVLWNIWPVWHEIA
jgi:hypothetical protein